MRIGDSYFAHKKLLQGDKTSGSLEKSYENPPLDLLDYIKELTDKHDLDSVAIDLFSHNKKYLINEIQCIFGQSDSYQMKVDGIIGRYIYTNDSWEFEQGKFNNNENYDLRLSHALLKHRAKK